MLSIMYIANYGHFLIFMETKIFNFFRNFIIAVETYFYIFQTFNISGNCI